MKVNLCFGDQVYSSFDPYEITGGAPRRSLPTLEQVVSKVKSSFALIRPNYISLKITPSRRTQNLSNLSLMNSVHELYRPLTARLSLKDWRISYESTESVFFDIYYTKDSIDFYLTIPRASFNIFDQKINNIWEGSACEIARFRPEYIAKDTIGYDLRYKKPDIFSLRTDRDDNDPLNNQLGIVEYLRGSDRAQVSIEFIPYNRKDWQDIAKDLYEEVREGRLPTRKEQLLGTTPHLIIKGLEWMMGSLAEEIGRFVSNNDSERDKLVDPEIQLMMNNNRFSNPTMTKLSGPTFITNITVLSQSTNELRRQSTLQAIANSYRDLSLDNELIARPLYGKSLSTKVEYSGNRSIEYKKHLINQLVYQWGPNIMSGPECAKLIQIPSAGLQEKFPQIDSIDVQENKIPEILSAGDKGIPFAYYEYKRKKQTIFIPTTDPDELCLPRIVVAGMGQGKTRGYASNFALEMFKKGMGSLALDVAKGEMLEEILPSLTEEELKKTVILDFSNVRWPIYLNWSEAMNHDSLTAGERLTSELMAFLLDKKDLDHYRTRKYLELAGKTVFNNPKATILDLLLVLTSKTYRTKCLKTLKDAEIKRDWRDFDDMTPSMQRTIYDPILYRLNSIMGQPIVKRSLCQQAKLDEEGGQLINFRKWMDEGYLVIVNAKKSDLTKQGMTDLVSFLTAKVWLTALTRNPQGQGLRPFFFIMDEPHQYLHGSVDHYESMVTESRKWRLGLVYLFHSWAQLKKESKGFADILLSALPHYHIYSTSPEELKQMKEMIKPYTVEEALKVKKHYAINVMRVGGEYHQFIARMVEPPSKRYRQRDNWSVIQEQSKLYGRSYEEVEADISERQKILLIGPEDNKRK